MKTTLFDHIADARRDPLAGRVVGLQIGVVVDVADPLKLNRIQVTTADKGGLTASTWCFMVSAGKGVTAPQPTIGDTAVIAYLEADAHKPVCLGILHNAINPPIIDGNHIFLPDSQTFSATVGQSALVMDKDSITLSQGSVVLKIANGIATINGKDIAVVGGSTNNGKITTKGY